MESSKLVRAALLTLVLVIVFTLGLEGYWRGKGFVPTPNDDRVTWAAKRHEIYRPIDQATVFIGGSRIKFDIDIATWKARTGEDAVQLALVGTPGRLVLHNLANDPRFVGKVVLDVAENQVFGLDTLRRDKSAREAIAYYYSETPAQKASAIINSKLEQNLALIEEVKFGLSALLNDLPIGNRPGVVVPAVFPKEFTWVTKDRQTMMTPMFLAEPKLQERQRQIWTRTAISVMEKTPLFEGDALTLFIKRIKADVEKIRARGGKVVFVRPPSSGAYLEAELKKFPRDKYWDRMVKDIDVPGIHFADYPAIANFICPEMSHLSPTDAKVFTGNLVDILQREKGWTFSGNRPE